MPTLRIEVALSDDVYRNAVALPIAERERIVAAVFATAINKPADEPLTPTQIESIAAGIRDMEAGDMQDGDEVFAALRERIVKKS